MAIATPPAPSARAARVGAIPIHAVILLALSLGAAGLAGAGLALWLGRAAAAGMPLLVANAAVAIAVAASVVGLALAGALVTQIARLDRALAWLAAGELTTPLAHGWPISQLFARADALSERIAQGAERERQAATYREEALRKVSEAAASEERNRLARELHDSIKQQLFSIGVSAATARARGRADTAALDDIERGAREAQVEMTALLQQLRPAPLENVGLVAALRDQCEALGYRTGAEVNVTIGALPGEDRLPPRAQEQIFRIAQEALANVARHARASHVWLRLEAEDDVMLLEVRDDGQGFTADTASGGMGLGNLRERARALGGSANITSAPGQGTTVCISAPLLPPLRVSAEELARQTRLAALERAGQRWLALCFTALDVAGALLIFGMPFWSVALGLATAVGAALLARPAWSEIVALSSRASEQARALGHRAREFTTWLLFTLALCVWYLPASQPTWGGGARLTGVVAGSALLLALGAIGWERWRRATDRYYRMLPPTQRRVAIQKRWDETVSLLGALSFIVVVGLIFGGWPITLPPHTPTEWSNTAGAALLALAGGFGIVELGLAWRWRRSLRAMTGSEARA